MSVLEIVLVALLGGVSVYAVVLRSQLTRSRVLVKRLEAERAARDPRRRRRSAPLVVRRAEKAVKAVTESADILRTRGVSGLVASSIEDLTEWVREDRAAVERFAAPDGTVTVFFSDIEGSTALNERLGDRAFVKVLARHDELVRTSLANHDGHVVKTQGDGFMVVFRQSADGVRAALEIQERLGRERGRLRSHDIAVRIGLHRGAVVARDGDYFGRNVALAARVAAEAAGGEVLVSDELRESLLDATEFVFDEVREVELKGFTGLQRLWLVG
ncbi:adenylate/guanylate cyclase catalytic domain protein [Aeromicrobium marinum DSM 15272]|uniref:Adenylate/guanylate cyclase catalytic domain protein n=1 Tax=Aeromicrobium marinum DSM 15272 TaxID=585531 RepID=E2SF93_9ACTN|nr:adenylate/guanylate cyclase domain-containing protein [Aeromicrobium marinum]EFQ82178.1 adenylate/guanylate cyclase catalytic domain protein [Aeromicrobium marinum DSM 15272]